MGGMQGHKRIWKGMRERISGFSKGYGCMGRI